MTWLANNWKPLLGALLLFLAAAAGWHEGGERLEATWQARWDVHEKQDQKAAAALEARERAEEQRRQLSVNKVMEDADKKIEQVRSDASAAADQRVRDAAAKYAGRVAALPPQARQQPSTPKCSPSCLGRLTAWRVSTQKLLTNPE